MGVTMRRIFLFLTSILLSAVSCETNKNVVLIIVDDLRPALGCYEDQNAFTPNMDTLARNSVQFNRAYAQQALCAPSRNSLLTSRRPDSLHLYDFYSYWRSVAGNFTTLPQHFKLHGYTTASFGKVFHPGASSNWSDDSPYSWTEPPFHPATLRYKDAAVCRGAGGDAHSNLVCPVEPGLQPGGTLPDLETLAAVQAFLRSRPGVEKPFFLAVGFHKPHVPLKFPRKYLEHHPLAKVTKPRPEVRPPTMPSVAWNPWTDLRQRDDVAVLNLTFPYEPIPANFGQVIRQSYYTAVTYVDDLVGQLLKTMEDENMRNNTIVVLLGDHGWSLGEHQEWAKYSNFELALRVPLLIHDPDLSNTRSNEVHEEQREMISSHLVELVDVFPTLCELTGITTPPTCDHDPSSQPLCSEGESLVPIMIHLLQNKTIKGKSGAFSQYPRPSRLPSLKSDKPRLRDITIMGYSLRTKRHRYTEWIKFKDLTPYWNEVVAVEMYDHHIDPEETVNLAGRRGGLEHVQKLLQDKLRAGWRYSRHV